MQIEQVFDSPSLYELKVFIKQSVDKVQRRCSKGLLAEEGLNAAIKELEQKWQAASEDVTVSAYHRRSVRETTAVRVLWWGSKRFPRKVQVIVGRFTRTSRRGINDVYCDQQRWGIAHPERSVKFGNLNRQRIEIQGRRLGLRVNTTMLLKAGYSGGKLTVTPEMIEVNEDCRCTWNSNNGDPCYHNDPGIYEQYFKFARTYRDSLVFRSPVSGSMFEVPFPREVRNEIRKLRGDCTMEKYSLLRKFMDEVQAACDIRKLDEEFVLTKTMEAMAGMI